MRRIASRTAPDVDLALLADGDDALRYFKRHAADLAVVDIFMDGLGGIELCRRLHAASRMPVMLATSHLTRELHDAAIGAGATRALAKPYDLALLVVELDELGDASDRVEGTRRDDLIASHLDLAHNIARRLARAYGDLVTPDDIEALARLGLCEAAERFDPRRAEPFLTFAETRIRGAVMDEVRRLGGYTRAGRSLRRRIDDVRRELANTASDHGPEAIAAALGEHVDVVHRADTPTRIVLEHSPETEVPSPEANTEHVVGAAELLTVLAGARAGLAPLEARILELHYDDEVPLAAVARVLRIPLRNVQRAHDRAIAWLKRHLDPRSSPP